VGAEEGKGMAKVEIGGHGKRGGEKVPEFCGRLLWMAPTDSI